MNNDKNSAFNLSTDFLDSYVKDAVGVIHLKDKVFEMATDISLKEEFFNKVKMAGELSDIKVLLIMNGDSVLGEEKSDQFWKAPVERQDREMLLHRKENALDQFIRLMCSFGKIVVSAVRGSVVDAFLGAILSADFRVASKSTVFTFPFMRYRMPPQGALAYFLPRYVGIAKAKNILFRAQPIQALEASNLELVDRVVPDADFEKHCIEFASELTAPETDIINMTKQLFKCSITEIDAYFKLEAELVGLPKMKIPPNQNSR